MTLYKNDVLFLQLWWSLRLLKATISMDVSTTWSCGITKILLNIYLVIDSEDLKLYLIFFAMV